LQIGRNDHLAAKGITPGLEQILVRDTGLLPVADRIMDEVGNNGQYGLVIGDYMTEIGHPGRGQPDGIAAYFLGAGDGL